MKKQQDIVVELSAVIAHIQGDAPHVLVTPDGALPSGPLETQHKKLEQALRSWVQTQTGLRLGYVEQLYTFADKDREAQGTRCISIGYLALTRQLPPPESKTKITSTDWYRFLPWEDRREEKSSALLHKLIQKNLKAWKNTAPDAATKKHRAARIDVNFPTDLRDWNEELVLQRYELLWEAGLIEEAIRSKNLGNITPLPGQAMAHDHRRILATGLARLRAKIKYRPVVFELLPQSFTLLQLQTLVEALAGLRLHKQNFRRLIQSQGLVEETDQQTQEGPGRPAKLFAFRKEILTQRAFAGTKLPRS